VWPRTWPSTSRSRRTSKPSGSLPVVHDEVSTSLPPIRSDPRLDRLFRPQEASQGLRAALPAAGDAWAITPELAAFLFRLVTEYRLLSVLEFGAGSSSVVLAAALAEGGGGHLTSVEQNPEWCAKRWKTVHEQATVDSLLIPSRPVLDHGKGGLFHVFRGAAGPVLARAPYDLVLIDAPQYFYGRDGSLHLAHRHLPAGAFIVLDDAGRSAECWCLRRWLRTYPGLELRVHAPLFGGKGIAVLQVVRPLRARLDALAIASSLYHTAECWFKRRRRRRRGLRTAPGD